MHVHVHVCVCTCACASMCICVCVPLCLCTWVCDFQGPFPYKKRQDVEGEGEVQEPLTCWHLGRLECWLSFHGNQGWAWGNHQFPFPGLPLGPEAAALWPSF